MGRLRPASRGAAGAPQARFTGVDAVHLALRGPDSAPTYNQKRQVLSRVLRLVDG